MSIENIAKRVGEITRISGKEYLNALYPEEFESYVIALELIDENCNTLQYFVFPINPNSVDESKTRNVNIKQTLGGLSIMNSPTFVPVPIILSGNFGRKLKIVLGEHTESLVNSFKVDDKFTSRSVFNGIKNIFDKRVKTGYGCIKILEEICMKSYSMADGKRRRLILHNLALGNSYVVKPISFKAAQTQDTNMVWSYSLQLVGIAPLSAIRNPEDEARMHNALIGDAWLQKEANALTNDITSFINRKIL